MKKIFTNIPAAQAVAATTVVAITALTVFASGPGGTPPAGNVDANFNSVTTALDVSAGGNVNVSGYIFNPTTHPNMGGPGTIPNPVEIKSDLQEDGSVTASIYRFNNPGHLRMDYGDITDNSGPIPLNSIGGVAFQDGAGATNLSVSPDGTVTNPGTANGGSVKVNDPEGFVSGQGPALNLTNGTGASITGVASGNSTGVLGSAVGTSSPSVGVLGFAKNNQNEPAMAGLNMNGGVNSDPSQYNVGVFGYNADYGTGVRGYSPGTHGYGVYGDSQNVGGEFDGQNVGVIGHTGAGGNAGVFTDNASNNEVDLGNDNFSISAKGKGIFGGASTSTPTPDHMLNIKSSDANTLRLLGPTGFYEYGDTLNFGDGNYAFIQENSDDHLNIFGNQGVSINGGNVGIGTTSPTDKLTVNGNTTVNGAETVNGNSTVNGTQTVNGVHNSWAVNSGSGTFTGHVKAYSIGDYTWTYSLYKTMAPNSSTDFNYDLSSHTLTCPAGNVGVSTGFRVYNGTAGCGSSIPSGGYARNAAYPTFIDTEPLFNSSYGGVVQMTLYNKTGSWMCGEVYINCWNPNG